MSATVTSKGVIATIIRTLAGANRAKPVTKATILSRCTRACPDSTPVQLARTINCQVPFRLARDKGLKVVGVDTDKGRGYYLRTRAAK